MIDGDGSYSLARLNAQWNRRVGEGARLEARAGIGLSRSVSRGLRVEQTAGVLSRTLEDSTDTHDRSLSASAKLIALIAAEHSLVAGVETEGNRRSDTHTTLQDGAPRLVDFGDNVSASASRFALYAQDEWALSRNWAAHAGLRWEGIATRGSGEAGQAEASNRSSVWSPLLHAVWKPDPNSRDQVRISLTRSYRSPTLGNLIARPSINTRYPVPGANTPTQPDRAGNPNLKPELATGIDIAIERYLPGSGILSANLFSRQDQQFHAQPDHARKRAVGDPAALCGAAAEHRRRADAGARARGEVSPQRSRRRRAEARPACERELLPVARQGGARSRQPARPAARLHRQPRRRLPLRRRAAYARRQPELDPRATRRG